MCMKGSQLRSPTASIAPNCHARGRHDGEASFLSNEMPTQGYVQISNQVLSRRLLGQSAAEALANIDSIVQPLNLMSELRR